jgi:ribonuclease R
LAKRGGPKQVPFPTRDQVQEFINGAQGLVGRREIARAFSIRGDDRRRLTALLKELDFGRRGRRDERDVETQAIEGEVRRTQPSRPARSGVLPDTLELIVTGTDREGELVARPAEWRGGMPPRIMMMPQPKGQEPLGLGDRVLARLKRVRGTLYEARAIRRISEGPSRVLGVYERTATGEGRLRPTDRRLKSDYAIATSDSMDAAVGELVAAEVLPGRGLGLRGAKIVERLGSMADPRSVSLVAIHTNDIPYVFPPDALAQAEAAVAAPLDRRTDLRQLPLVTIDGEDARDFDDAVFAERDGSGWHAVVAIADVAWYVRPGDALDAEAVKRGNSVYFPDRVVPMLPEPLSNGWCSLKPREDRPCMAVHLWLDAEGNRVRYRFERALMRSAARLTYTQVQKALDGTPDETTRPLLDSVLRPLEGAWRALLAERQRRGVLELDLPERQVILGPDGRIAKIMIRPRYNSHRLIEDFMIAANVAAAEQIEAAHQPCMYRVHDVPDPERLDALRTVLETLGLNLPKGGRVLASQFNRVLARAAEMPDAQIVNEMILRSQAQAAYSPNNIGHFGLGLARYAHFTSPIRRYADLLVHRAIIAGLKLGDGGLPPVDPEDFVAIGDAISETERRAATAERDSLDRFTVLFLADRVGATFEGTISGVARFGLFVKLDETGADGLLPVSALPADFYHHDEHAQRLVGKRSGATYALGDAIAVRLSEANVITGSLLFQAAEGAPISLRRKRTGQSGGRPDKHRGPKPQRGRPQGKRRK